MQPAAGRVDVESRHSRCRHTSLADRASAALTGENVRTLRVPVVA
ncbi:hypothetical protein [Ruania alba]|nr:hypothetical protein [Ruania alba]